MSDERNMTPVQSVVPYDENLLERARTQWQFGDWESLAKLDRSALQHHPDRARLALLAAAGALQLDRISDAKSWIQLHKDWGGDRKLLARILVAGMHTCLGRFHLAKGQDQNAIDHFEEAIRIACPDADARLFGEARAVREAARIGLLPQAARIMNDQLERATQVEKKNEARVSILETEVGLLRHELSLAQQRQQLYRPLRQFPDDGEPDRPTWLEHLRRKSVSQLGQDLWVLERTNYKRGGFFVEFGATDGVLLSNTWLLETEFGWQGICAEPNPKFYAQLKKNRGCKVSNQYIGRESGQRVEFILADVYGAASEFAASDQHNSKRDAYREAGYVTTVTSISLDEFLREHGAPRIIDYLSVDTEGSEFDILSAFPFEEWNIHLLTVEHNFTDQRRKIRNLLEAHGYRCIEREWDDWYERIVC